jgi:hypothetical protein
VLGISVRGTAPLPETLLPEGFGPGYHWGDDIQFEQRGEGVDSDPGFARAKGWVLERLVGEVLVEKW